MNRNYENVDPLTTEIYEAVIQDLQGHSNHLLQVDTILTKQLDKIKCGCPNCIKIKNEVTCLLRKLHNEVVLERMRDTSYVTEAIKSFATSIINKSLKSEDCFWNR